MTRPIQSYPWNRQAAVVLRRIAGGQPAVGLGLQAALDAVKFLRSDDKHKVNAALKGS